jgi:hypothetical protein
MHVSTLQTQLLSQFDGYQWRGLGLSELTKLKIEDTTASEAEFGRTHPMSTILPVDSCITYVNGHFNGQPSQFQSEGESIQGGHPITV